MKIEGAISEKIPHESDPIFSLIYTAHLTNTAKVINPFNFVDL